MNFLFLFPDQHRPDWLGGTPGLPLRTPHLDGLRARGTQFTRAICPSPLCAPSRACVATGCEYPRAGVRDNRDDLPPDRPTFYRLLRDAGYHVAGCGKFDLHKASYVWGPEGRHGLDAWGFSDGIDNEGKIDAVLSGREAARGPYMAYLERRGLKEVHVRDIDCRRADKHAAFPTPLPADAYCDNWIGDNALDLMRRFPAGRPWFLQVNFTGPHNPWDVTGEMAAWYAGQEFPLPVDNHEAAAAVHQGVRRNYAAMIENIDRLVGELLAEVRRRGEENDTLVIYASDHGEMLGDHGRWGKTLPYQPSVGVPLIAAGPGVAAGRTIDAPATILDLPATFLDYAGLPVPSEMDSRSLRPLLGGGVAPRDHAFSALGEWRLVFDGRYKLIENFGGTDLLFDLAQDPQELRNLLTHQPEITRRLRRLFPHPREEPPLEQRA